MSIIHSLDSQRTTEEKATNHENEAPFTAGLTGMVPNGSPRFGALSHNAFFSRHNPHPNRVRHIQGLNGRLVCMVKDDSFSSAPLFPHPLIKSQVFRTDSGAPFGLPFGSSLNRVNNTKARATLLSEAWREELKELAAKISQASKAKKDEKPPPEDGPSRRKTQYSAQTGRIIPTSSTVYQRRTQRHQRQTHPLPLYDQELTVLELLCQILQTDSLSMVQQWLLLATQREKDVVMGLIQQALVDMETPDHQKNFQAVSAFRASSSLPSQGPLCGLSRRTSRSTSSFQAKQLCSDSRPERIGEAEVLEIHPGLENCHLEEPVEHTHRT